MKLQNNAFVEITDYLKLIISTKDNLSCFGP